MQTLHNTRFRISSMCFWNVERRGVVGVDAFCRESAAAIFKRLAARRVV
jgi:hypothetical protein